MRSVFCQPYSGRECYSNLPEFLKNKWETRWNCEWGRRGDPNSHKMKNTYISQIIFFSLLTIMASGIFTLVERFGEGKKKKKKKKKQKMISLILNTSSVVVTCLFQNAMIGQKLLHSQWEVTSELFHRCQKRANT